MFYDIRWEKDADREHVLPWGCTIIVAEENIKAALQKALPEIPDAAERVWIKRNKHLAIVKL